MLDEEATRCEMSSKVFDITRSIVSFAFFSFYRSAFSISFSRILRLFSTRRMK